jgi:hypothetical protein
VISAASPRTSSRFAAQKVLAEWHHYRLVEFREEVAVELESRWSRSATATHGAHHERIRHQEFQVFVASQPRAREIL